MDFTLNEPAKFAKQKGLSPVLFVATTTDSKSFYSAETETVIFDATSGCKEILTG